MVGREARDTATNDERGAEEAVTGEDRAAAGADVFAAVVRLRRERVPGALCTVVRTAGSTPRRAGAKMVVGSQGLLAGTVGGGRIEKEVVDAAVAALQARAQPQLLRFHLTHQLAMCCGGEMEIFVEPLLPEPVLVVCGGGHVAQALVPLARKVGFCPVLVEDLEELGSPARFPDAARIIDSFAVADWQGITLGGECYVVVVTRDHRQDQELLESLLGYDLAYLGLIGSRRKIAVFQQRLLARGASPERLARVHAPIGLAIGADTPEEIAVAIAAELIQVRAARRGGRGAGGAGGG